MNINKNEKVILICSIFFMHLKLVHMHFNSIAAIPLVVILAFIPWLLPYDSISIPYLPIFHVIASLAPWIGSILYHIFMNHENGYSVYKAVLTIDLLGIWTTQTTGKYHQLLYYKRIKDFNYKYTS